MEHMKRMHDSDDITKAYLRMANGGSIFIVAEDITDFSDTFDDKDTAIPQQFSCITCKKRFQSKELAEKHILTCNFCCGICQKIFKLKQTLTRHVKTVHNQLKPTIKCDDCQEEFDKKGDLKEHIKSHTPLNSKIIYGKRKREVSSMSGVIKRANLQCPNFI